MTIHDSLPFTDVDEWAWQREAHGFARELAAECMRGAKLQDSVERAECAQRELEQEWAHSAELERRWSQTPVLPGGPQCICMVLPTVRACARKQRGIACWLYSRAVAFQLCKGLS